MQLSQYLSEGIYVINIVDVNGDSYNDLVTLDRTE